jgi:hypothetical protein
VVTSPNPARRLDNSDASGDQRSRVVYLSPEEHQKLKELATLVCDELEERLPWLIARALAEQQRQAREQKNGQKKISLF